MSITASYIVTHTWKLFACLLQLDCLLLIDFGRSSYCYKKSEPISAAANQTKSYQIYLLDYNCYLLLVGKPGNSRFSEREYRDAWHGSLIRCTIPSNKHVQMFNKFIMIPWHGSLIRCTIPSNKHVQMFNSDNKSILRNNAYIRFGSKIQTSGQRISVRFGYLVREWNWDPAWTVDLEPARSWIS